MKVHPQEIEYKKAQNCNSSLLHQSQKKTVPLKGCWIQAAKVLTPGTLKLSAAAATGQAVQAVQAG